jgi:HAD superfamily hydrolase (TIGR01509 family)
MPKKERASQFGVLLDLDGTILNSMVPLKEAFIEISSKIGVTIDEEQQKRIGRELRMIMGGRPTSFSEFAFIWRIGRILGLSYWRRMLLLLASYSKLKRTANLAPPVEGAAEAIRRLKEEPSIKLGIVTSRNRKYVTSKLRSLELLDCFDVIVTRNDVQSFKPSPEQVMLAARMLGLPVERCVLVGDMPTDVDAAKEVNALSVAVVTGIFLDEVKSRKPDLIINSVADLPNSLEEIAVRLSAQKHTNNCSYCGQELPDGLEICPSCRELLQRTVDSSRPTAVRTSRARLPKFLTIVTIFFVMGVMFGANFIPRNLVEVTHTIPGPTVTQTIREPTVTQTIQGPIISSTPAPTANATSVASPSTQVTYEFSGNGEKTTETFSIPTSKWKILFKVTGDPHMEKYMTFSLYVYIGNQSKYYVYSKELHNYGEDYYIIQGAGNYYFKVDSANCIWEIIVTAPP